MFTNNYNKSTFGTPSTSSAFGFGTTTPANATPFGQTQQFGKTTTTPAFGTNAPLFGNAPQPNAAPLFSNTAFGATQSSAFGTGLFGQQQTPGANALFSNTSVPSFGQQNKASSFGFGAPASSTLFGQQQPQTFQTQSTSGVFGSTPSFGVMSGAQIGTQMGTVTKFNPVTGTDTMQKSGITHSINTKHHCITCMKDYENKSFEELRWEDYQCNRKGPQQQSSFGASPFGAPATSAPLFGQTDNKSAFAQPSTSFGTAPTAFGTQQSLFGKPTGAFGTTPTTNAFGFNSNTSFGVNNPVKSFTPVAQNVFSTPATQQTAFGSNLFAPANAQANQSGIFGAKTSSFGTQPVFTFGQTNTFQTPKTTSAFGSSFAQPTLTSNTGFAQPTNMFSQVASNPFTNLQKPATQPVFGQTQPTGFMSSQPVNNSYFGTANKPLFSNTPTSYYPGNTGFMLPQQQPLAPTHLTGLESQQQMPDFNKTVEQIYDFFPRQNFLLELGTTQDTTNPTDINNILEAESPLTMTFESRLRIIPKSTHFVSSINYQKQTLLADLNDPENISSVISTSSRRLNLRKSSAQRANETSVDCSLSVQNISKPTEISQFSETNSANMFRNIQTLQDLGQNIQVSPSVMHNYVRNAPVDVCSTPPFYKQQFSSKPKILDLPSDTCEEEYLQEINVLSQHVRTLNQASSSQKVTEEFLQKFYKMESPPPKSKEESFQGPSDTFRKSPQKGFTIHQNLVTDLAKKLASPDSSISEIITPEDSSILSKSGKSKSGKTVRFIDDDSESDSYSTPTRSTFATRSQLSGEGDDSEDNTEAFEPCGIKLTRQEYYTLPPFQDLEKYKGENGACLIKGFTIGRTGYGNIYFPDEIDISNMDLDDIIHFRYREVQVYPNEDSKPPENHGLNRRAQVTLDHIWPKGHTPGKNKILDSSSITHLIDRLCDLSIKQNAKFLDYRPETGSWVFNVEHFSKYTYEEEEETYVPPKTDVKLPRRDYILDDAALFQNKEATYVHDLGGSRYKEQQGFEKVTFSPITSRIKHMGGRLSSVMDFSDDNHLEKLKQQHYIRAVNDSEKTPVEKHQKSMRNESLDDEPLIKRSITYMHMFKDLEDIKELDEQSRLNDIQQLEDMDHFNSIDHLNGMNNLVLSQIVDEALYEEDFLNSKLMNEAGKDIGDDIPMRTLHDDDSLSDESSISEISNVTGASHSISSVLFNKKQDQTFNGTALNPVLDEYEYFLPNNFENDVPYCKSLLTTRNYKDAAIYKGRTFRVGWAEGFTSILMSQTILEEDIMSCPINLKDKLVSKVKFDSLHNSFSEINLEEHLKIVCEESVVSLDETGVPLFAIKKGCRSIMRHNYTSEIYDKEFNNGFMSYFNEVWGLCLAFWGPNASTPTERLELFIKWLDSTTICCMKPDLDIKNVEKSVVFKNIFAYLSAHQIEEAAQLALDKNLPALALLISQCGSSESAKQLMHCQLEEWKNNGVIKHMDTTLLKIYMLLAGVSIMSDVNVCENLDWKRALGIHVWYMISPGTSLVSGIQSYCNAFSELNYARKPVPKHCDLESNTFDLQYHVMLLFQNIVTGLNVVLDPITYTDNAIDYRLSWLLLQGLDALKVGSISEESSNYIHISFSSQLEDVGMWKWAIFVLLFVKDSNIKRDAIMGILYRNMVIDRADEANLEIEDTLVREFNIPSAWLHTVLANKSEMANAPLETYMHLTLLGDWVKAHEVAMLKVIPKLITSGQIEELLIILHYMIPGSNQILTWQEDVGLIIEFLEIRHRLIAKRNAVTEFELQAVGSQLLILCSKVKKIETTTTFQSLAIAEIARFISELLIILFKEIEHRRLNSLPDISLKLQALVMPPDFKHKDLLRYFDNYVNVET